MFCLKAPVVADNISFFAIFFQMFNIWISQRFGLDQASIHTYFNCTLWSRLYTRNWLERVWLFEIYKDLMVFLSVDLEDLACITLKLLSQGNESILSQFKISNFMFLSTLTCKTTKQIENAFLNILSLFILILKIWSILNAIHTASSPRSQLTKRP